MSKPMIVTVTGVLVETVCVYCKGAGNFDVTTDDGAILKCPMGPCVSCAGTGRVISRTTVKDFVALMRQELARSEQAPGKEQGK